LMDGLLQNLAELHAKYCTRRPGLTPLRQVNPSTGTGMLWGACYSLFGNPTPPLIFWSKY
jgi:hypothetical protein